MLSKYKVYPEAFSSVVTISITSDVPGNFIIAMADMKSSKIIRMAGVEVRKGATAFFFKDLEDLPASDYLVKIKCIDGDEVYQTHLRKIRPDQFASNKQLEFLH